MLNEFKTHYDLHRWVRYLSWTGLGGVTLFLLWSEGGFPPLAWRLFAQEIHQFRSLWATSGIAVLFPLALLAVLSLMWLLAWSLLLWISVVLLWPRKHDARHIAWRESRSLNIREVLLLHEDTLQEDTVNVRKLTLPHKAMSVSHASAIGNDSAHPSRQLIANGVRDNVGVGNDALRPSQRSTANKDAIHRPLQEGNAMNQSLQGATANKDAIHRSLQLVGAAQRNRPTTPLPHTASARTWQRQQPNTSSIDDVPTTPERPSRTGKLASQTRTRLDVGVGWNSGITRQSRPNEDSLVVLQGTCTYNDRLVPFGLFVVADGMGGHDFGREASHIAMQCMMQTVLRDIVASDSLNDTIIIELLVKGVEKANTAICQRCREWGKDMGTTLTAALIVDTKAYVVNVGDSRTYLYDESNGLSQITLDHSLVANLVMAGVITTEEVYTHPDRNKVYRSLGNRDGVEVDWFTRDLRRGDSLLLCSDGLWEMVRDPDIRRLVGSGQEPMQICDMLVQAALRGGGADNVSVIVVKVE